MLAIDSGPVGAEPTLVERFIMFTDIVDSTPRWESEAAVMRTLLRIHDNLLTEIVEGHGGEVVKRTGDGLCAAFVDGQLAVKCAVEIQRRLEPELQAQAPSFDPLAVRIGIHAGVVEPRLGDLHGPAMNRAARITAAGHGRQIVVSDLVVEVSGWENYPELGFVPLGNHRLKGLRKPEALFQVSALGLVADFPPVRSLNSDSGNLPAVPTNMVNRIREIARLEVLLQDSKLITLVGPGGVGKTRLALHVARESGSGFLDGVWFVDLAPIGEAGRVLQTLAAVLGIVRNANTELGAQVREALESRSMLIVLDNCEHLHDEVVRVLKEVLGSAVRSVVLATSQRRLGLTVESVVLVEPFEVVGPQIDLPVVDLFVQRAESVNPQFQLTDSNRPAIREICQRLDGLPLAIELAAARCSVLTPEAIAVRLDKRFSLLRGNGDSDRHRTLHSAIGWSFELLAPTEQEVLESISVFEGPFDWAAAVAVTQLDEFDVLDALTNLIDRSLLTRTGDHFRLLESVKSFAGSRLDGQGTRGVGGGVSRADLLNRHADFYCRSAAKRIDNIDPALVRARIEELSVQFNDLRLAFVTALGSDSNKAGRLACDLMTYWVVRGIADIGLDWLLESYDRANDVALRIEILGLVSGLGWMAGRNADSERWAREAIRIAEETQSDFPAMAGSRLALHLAFEGKNEEAMTNVESTLQELSTKSLWTPNGSVLAVVIFIAGDAERALKVAEDGVRVARTQGANVLISALANLRIVLSEANAVSVEVATELADLSRAIGRSEGEAQAMLALASIARSSGDTLGSVRATVGAAEIMIAAHLRTSCVTTLDGLPSLLYSDYPLETATIIGSLNQLHHVIGQSGVASISAKRRAIAESIETRLGRAEFDRATRAGAAMSLEELVDYMSWVCQSVLAPPSQAADSVALS